MTGHDSEDTDNRGLLSRRQVLAMFGGTSLGIALVGGAASESFGGSDAGSLYGGTSAMAELYKIGPNTWKGPLSVRSEVPETDGNSFWQTDAGSSNDQFAFYHYDGGWSKQGWDVTSLSADRTDTKRFTSAFNAQAKAIYRNDPSTFYESRFNRPIYLSNQLYSTTQNAAGRTSFIVGGSSSDAVWATTINGGWELVINDADLANSPKQVAVDEAGYWISVTQSNEVYVYSSASNWRSGTVSDSITSADGQYPVYAPFAGGLETHRDSGSGWIWAEYLTASQSTTQDPRILKKTAGSAGFTEVFSLTQNVVNVDGTDFVIHFHGLVKDPHQSGRFIAYTGDQGSQIQWYESTDSGENWSAMTGAGGSQDWRTLNPVFSPDGATVYWGSDTKESRLFSGDRGDPTSNKTELADLTRDVSGDLKCYGACLVEEMDLIVLVMADEGNNGYESIPVYGYHIETDTLRTLTELPTDYQSGFAGCRSVTQRPDMGTGAIYLACQGIRNPGGYDFHSQRLDVSQAMT